MPSPLKLNTMARARRFHLKLEINQTWQWGKLSSKHGTEARRLNALTRQMKPRPRNTAYAASL